jgi:RNA polymerase sigma-70 factor (ECF subfamily)
VCMVDDEDELISRAIAGDQAAWELLVHRYTGRLFNTALRHLDDDEQAANDAVQEVWLRVFRCILSYDRKAKFYTWLYRICVHICIDTQRRRKVVLALNENLRARVLGVDDQVILKRKMAVLRRALIEMDPLCRESLLLSVDGYSSSEIGKILGKPSSTVRSRIDRARSVLVQAMLVEGHDSKGKEA